uniref:Endonuclease/exonuclease/phosphatase domain-containing protein n=1 Tax=Tanacetum cinerariifolium TaxID=118510 RepID=A0A6L2KCY2_TANCI|nr:hypothetical protein [Tanacetum cinerariifolium]
MAGDIIHFNTMNQLELSELETSENHRATKELNAEVIEENISTIIGTLNNADLLLSLRFGTPPLVSGDSPHVSEFDPGNRATTATAAIGNRRHCRRRPPPHPFCCLYLLEGRIEAVDSDGHLRPYPSSLGGTKWKGSRAREGNGYKLWYSGSSKARNGVGVMVVRRLKDDVVRVTRRSDRIMAISVVIDGEAVNVISAYASQMGLSDADKKRFWDALDELVRECPADERLIIGGDLNGHTELQRMDMQGKRRHKREAIGRPRILWKNLKGEAVETFRANVSKKLSALKDVMSARNANQMWNTFTDVIRDVAKDSLGVASKSARTYSTYRESWWFCEEVQTKVAMKQSRFKELLACRDGILEDIDLDKERYKAAKREAKIAVAHAKDEAYEDLYKKLDSKEGANDIYKIAKAREKEMGYRKHDIVLITELAEGLNNKIERWREALEDNGLRVSREKTEYLRCDFGRYEVAHQEVDIRIGDRILQPNESFRYLRSVIHRSGRIYEDFAHRIGVGWMKWRAASSVLCDRRIPLKLKRKFYRVAIRPAMLAELDVDSIIDKMREGRLRWFGHVRRRPQSVPVRRVEAMLVEGSRRRGRPRLRWEDRLKQEMKELLLSNDMTSDRNA